MRRHCNRGSSRRRMLLISSGCAREHTLTGRMADKYGCSVDYLLCRTEDPRPYPGFEKRTYSDKRQAAINGYYESLGEEGKETLHRVARGLGKDGANRIEKDGAEHLDDSARLDA